MLRIHVVRHFPAVKNADIEKAFGATEGGKLRPLNPEKTVRLAPIFRARLKEENPRFELIGHSPTIRTASTMMIATIGIANVAPVVEVPELYWTDESIAGIMADFKIHDVNTSKWSPEGLMALYKLGMTGAEGIRRVLAEKAVTDGDVLFVGHGPLTGVTAALLAGTEEAMKFCLSCVAKEGSRFVIEGTKVIFVPLE